MCRTRSGCLVVATVIVATGLPRPTSSAPPAANVVQTTWVFDSLERIGGAPVTVEGHPRIIESPLGKAIEFNGVDDALFIDRHPLAGADTFTFEAVFRPDGGKDLAQRWFHL